MSFDSFGAFLQMGAHALYVWSAFSIGILVLLLNVWLPRRAHRRYLRQEARRLRREKTL